VISEFAHTPVLLPESIAALKPRPGGRFIDATLGGGGHAEKVLELSRPNGIVLGLDIDPTALDAARTRLASYGGRLITVNAFFDDMATAAAEFDLELVDGVLFDLGVSSSQLETPERGFSFQAPGPLDMRLGHAAGPTARDLVNDAPLLELERIFRDYGEERYARRIAQRIGWRRAERRIETTLELADLVAGAVPRRREGRIHPATRVFQALRIAVNDELDRLRHALPQAVRLLAPGGRLAVISFHSLEDRIVKQFIRAEVRGCICPPDFPVCVCGRTPTLRQITTRPLTASDAERAANPRARSAKLRVAERVAV
jgi:16S rRNA (cytosine1402-N4)-methyltransferase